MREVKVRKTIGIYISVCVSVAPYDWVDWKLIPYPRNHRIRIKNKTNGNIEQERIDAMDRRK